jgi:E3 ubiquitin-protein ligase TRIP12
LLVTNALQLVELLLIKSPSVFRNSLRKEGVLHEVSTISKIELKIKAKPPPETAENGEGNTEEGSAPPPPRKTSSVPSDPQDAYVLRARLIKVKYLTGGSDIGGDPLFDSLKAMIKALADPEANEEQLGTTLKDIAKLFGSSVVAISSFELLKSGLVDGLLDFATAPGRKGQFFMLRDYVVVDMSQ